MRKWFSVILTFIMAFACWFGFGSSSRKAFASTVEAPILTASIESELKNFLQYDEAEKTRLAREAGSTGEADASAYILSSLLATPGIEAINDGYFVSGVQAVEYVSSNGFSSKSQNVGVVIKSATENAKTVTFCTNIDNVAVIEAVSVGGEPQEIKVFTESVNQSAGSVALLMALARHFATSVIDLGFNIEFAFLGAGAEENSGALALNRRLNTDASKYALVVCVDKVVLGDSNYIFMQDFGCEYASYISEIMVGHYNFKNFNKTSCLAIGSGVNLFSHAGVAGSAGAFYGGKINMLSVFSGNYNGVSGLGNSESTAHKNLTYTLYDNIASIEGTYDISIKTKLGMVASALANLLYQPDFIVEAGKPNNLQNAYGFWYNEKYQLFAYGVCMVLVFVVYFIVYDGLMKKSQKNIADGGIESLIVNIAEPGDPPQEEAKMSEKEEPPKEDKNE
ncbi:MAG: hypothetical protein IJS68_00230 [Clostridia bacterium]|nr:hypothetical protein [Clostridia bacterium]